MRCLVKEQGLKIFPVYQHVRAAEEQCRPSTKLVSITNTEARVILQGLLNHTVKQIVVLQAEVNVQHVQTETSTK